MLLNGIVFHKIISRGRFTMNIRNRILAPAIAIVTSAIVIVLVAAVIIFSGFFDNTIGASVETYSKVLMDEFNDVTSQSESSTLMFTGDDEIQSAIAAGDREALLARANELNAESPVDFATVMDPEGNVILRMHDPDNFGDNLASQENVQHAMAGEVYTTVEEGSAVKLSVRTGAPVYNDEGEIAALISAGFRLDTDNFVDTVKEIVGGEVTVFLGDTRVSTTVVQADGTRAVGT
jgi:methyl-accepting chemotaxis protein